MLMIPGALPDIAAVILIVLPWVGGFETNRVPAAGFGCPVHGSLINFISIFMSRK
jgi:hypothetical protein